MDKIDATKTDIRTTVYNLYDEFMAHGAWMWHAYGFEHMQEYYEIIRDYMTKNDLDCAALETAYQNATLEFDALASDENRSFLKKDDTKRLEDMDNKFLDELAHAAQTVADMLGIGNSI